ncbi:MAG: hypothetical protein QOG25_3995, partial [Acetobacteraceae bacterium]|nr:hypothetical protein [Acetobacteraceae bacterium]
MPNAARKIHTEHQGQTRFIPCAE